MSDSSVAEKISKSEFALMRDVQQIAQIIPWLHSEIGAYNAFSVDELMAVFGDRSRERIGELIGFRYINDLGREEYKVLTTVSDWQGSSKKPTADFEIWKKALEQVEGIGGMLNFPLNMKVDDKKVSERTIKRLISKGFFAEIQGVSVEQAVTVYDPFSEAEAVLGRKIPQVDAESVLETIKNLQARGREGSQSSRSQKTQKDPIPDPKKEEKETLLAKETVEATPSGIESKKKVYLAKGQIVEYSYFRGRFGPRGNFLWPSPDEAYKPGGNYTSSVRLDALVKAGCLTREGNKFTVLDVDVKPVGRHGELLKFRRESRLLKLEKGKKIEQPDSRTPETKIQTSGKEGESKRRDTPNDVSEELKDQKDLPDTNICDLVEELIDINNRLLPGDLQEFVSHPCLVVALKQTVFLAQQVIDAFQKKTQ